MADFYDGTKAIEIKHALQIVNLLKHWETANDTEKKELLHDPVFEKLLTQYQYDIPELIWRLNKAVDAYDYKPKKQSIFDFATEPDFDYMPVYVPKYDIELHDAFDCLNLLRRYTIAKTDDEKNIALSKLDKYSTAYSNAIKNGQKTSQDLFLMVFKAMNLNRYRPKNMKFTDFVFSNDLDYIGGDFDTFDLDLSRDLKNNTPDTQIRDKFDKATANRFNLIQQFVLDWSLRLDKHPELVIAAKNSNDNNKIEAYTKLCTALANDFCDDYHLPHEAINVEIINEDNDSKISGYLKPAFRLPTVLRQSLTTEEIQAFNSAPDSFPGAKKLSKIVMNMTTIEKHYPDKNYFFNKFISIFAHEMSHALDYLISRYGALGPQVSKADAKTYTTQDDVEYRKSATKRVAFDVDEMLFTYLNNKDK